VHLAVESDDEEIEIAVIIVVERKDSSRAAVCQAGG
jgi:hypothetical protein